MSKFWLSLEGPFKMKLFDGLFCVGWSKKERRGGQEEEQSGPGEGEEGGPGRQVRHQISARVLQKYGEAKGIKKKISFALTWFYGCTAKQG